jgi:hypothetical protein
LPSLGFHNVRSVRGEEIINFCDFKKGCVPSASQGRLF